MEMPSAFKMTGLAVWGDPGAGKSLFAITCPFKPILYFDTEKSTTAYREHFSDGITWKDIKSYDEFTSTLKEIEPGKYTTIVVDSATWVQTQVEEAKRREWKKNSRDPEKQGQMFWSEVGKTAEAISVMAQDKAKLLLLTALARGKFQKPLEREPRLNQGFVRTLDLCLELQRTTNQRVPHGITSYRNRFLQLPPRIPEVTWSKLLDWLGKPPINWEELSKEFFVPEELQAAVGLPQEGAE
jgi:hypothetical protein